MGRVKGSLRYGIRKGSRSCKEDIQIFKSGDCWRDKKNESELIRVKSSVKGNWIDLEFTKVKSLQGDRSTDKKTNGWRDESNLKY